MSSQVACRHPAADCAGPPVPEHSAAGWPLHVFPGAVDTDFSQPYAVRDDLRGGTRGLASSCFLPCGPHPDRPTRIIRRSAPVGQRKPGFQRRGCGLAGGGRSGGSPASGQAGQGWERCGPDPSGANSREGKHTCSCDVAAFPRGTRGPFAHTRGSFRKVMALGGAGRRARGHGTPAVEQDRRKGTRHRGTARVWRADHSPSGGPVDVVPG